MPEVIEPQDQPTAENHSSQLRSDAVIALIISGIVLVSLVLRPPLSTLLLLLIAVSTFAYALYTLRDSFTRPRIALRRLAIQSVGAAAPAVEAASAQRPSHIFSLPRTATPYRNLLAAIAAVSAMTLFVAAAIDFDPLLNQKYINEGAAKMLAGAGLLATAVLLSTRRPSLAQPVVAPLSTPRRRWRWAVVVGALPILFLSEANGQFLKIEALRYVHINVQFALLLGGTLLILYGLGGAPPLRLSVPRMRREDRWHVAAVLGIMAVALFLRLWNQEGTLRVLIDELHWSDGLQRIVYNPWTAILYPMSGVSPYTNLFPYWQAGAAELIGYTWTGFRFVSAICGSLTVLAVYGLGRAIFDRHTALLGMLVFASFPSHIHFSRVALLSIADPLFGTMAVMFIARALRRNHRIEWAAAGISLGFTQYFYEGGRLLFPALVLGWLIVLAISGHLKGRWRGVVILLAAFVFIGGPVYYTLLGNDQPLFGRMDESGDGKLTEEISTGVNLDDLSARVRHMLSAFMMFGAHHDLSVYYGGEQALVNTVILPLMLFGAFYLLWRFPAPAFIIPLWIIATGAGNGLLRDTLVSARYYVVMPALSLAIMAGVRYFTPFLARIVPQFKAQRLSPVPAGGDNDSGSAALKMQIDPLPPRRHALWRWAGVVTVITCTAVSAYHVSYYYGPHLEGFNVQVRDYKGYRDGIDAALRSVELPGSTQAIIIGQPPHDVSVARHFLTFLSHEEGSPARFFPLLSLNTATVSPRYLRDLAPGVNYAFFVEPHDNELMRAIYQRFPNAGPPDYTVWNIPAHKQYIMIWAPVGSGR